MANKLERSATCIIVSLTLLLGGCANTGSSLLSNTKPDPRLTTTEQSKFFTSSAAQGCGVGALAGAGLGALVGVLAGDSKKALVGAAAGGAAGCAAGMATNYYLDNLKKDYATTADRLQAMDKDISKDTADVAKTSAAMKEVISDNHATLTKISLQKDNAGFDKASANKELAQVDANIKVMKDKIKVMNEKTAAYKVALQGQSTTTPADKDKLKTLNTEYTQLNSQIVALEKEADGLYNQRQAISLG
jgi:predicted  nucleic acid-binding Zn-ribbon protein